MKNYDRINSFEKLIFSCVTKSGRMIPACPRQGGGVIDRKWYKFKIENSTPATARNKNQGLKFIE